jgi:ADP-ribose pyrophosphatase YjhB (NUDIX family)
MRMFNDQFLVGVTGIFLNEDDEVLLFKHTYRNGHRWSLPGGYIKAREHPREGLEREVKEESGMIVSADERLKLRTDRETARFDITYVGKYMGENLLLQKRFLRESFFLLKNFQIFQKINFYL